MQLWARTGLEAFQDWQTGSKPVQSWSSSASVSRTGTKLNQYLTSTGPKLDQNWTGTEQNPSIQDSRENHDKGLISLFLFV